MRINYHHTVWQIFDDISLNKKKRVIERIGRIALQVIFIEVSKNIKVAKNVENHHASKENTKWILEAFIA
jgi:hypothetical protein